MFIRQPLFYLVVMSQASSEVDVTSANPETYNSSHLAKFAWVDNPIGDDGFLVIRFQGGEEYIYMGVPEDVAEQLENRAMNPNQFNDSVGQYFNRVVRNNFLRRGVDYQRMQ